MFAKFIQFVYVMLYALVAGVMWGTWVSLGRTMTDYDERTFLADGQHMIANLGRLMAILMISAAVAGALAVVVLFLRRSTGAAWLSLLGLLLLGGVLAVTLGVEVPIDNDINRWTVDTLPADWATTRARWADFHTLRTFLSLVGLASVIGAALAIRPAVDHLEPGDDDFSPTYEYGLPSSAGRR
jgi:hypothetical protein